MIDYRLDRQTLHLATNRALIGLLATAGAIACTRTRTAPARPAPLLLFRVEHKTLQVSVEPRDRILKQRIFVENQRADTAYADLCSMSLKRKEGASWTLVSVPDCAGCPPSVRVLPHDTSPVNSVAWEAQNIVMIGPKARLDPGEYRVEMQIGYGAVKQCAGFETAVNAASETFVITSDR